MPLVLCDDVRGSALPPLPPWGARLRWRPGRLGAHLRTSALERRDDPMEKAQCVEVIRLRYALCAAPASPTPPAIKCVSSSRAQLKLGVTHPDQLSCMIVPAAAKCGT